MDPMDMVTEAIDQYIQETGLNPEDLIVIMGPSLYEQIERPMLIDDVAVVVSERIKDDFFGILHIDCMDHIGDHLDEILAEYGPDWINCDLCDHPLNVVLADGDKLKCLWCGDVNDMDEWGN